jgi:hypothetical protein
MAARMPLSLYSEHYFAKKIKKNLHMSQNLRNFVRFLARKPAKAEKTPMRNQKSKI